MAERPIPETMLEAVRQFADPAVAHDFFVQLRWPGGVVACPRACGSISVAYMPKRRRWYCNDCKGQFTAKVGTIFEDSPIGFDKWLPAIWLIASNRNGISSCELARALKVQQRTAWFMLHRIRVAMRNENFEPMRWPVEADETYVGGKVNLERDHHGRAKRNKGPNYKKTTVMGIFQRGGGIRTFVVPSGQGITLRERLRASVAPGETVYTDAAAAYGRLSSEYVHYVINHANEYVRGHIHTNNIEGFWSVFKPTLKGTYVALRPHQLQRYVEEQVFCFNERLSHDGVRFVKAVEGADGNRLTYKEMTTK